MYDLPSPPKPVRQPTAKELATGQDFVYHLISLCEAGGGLIDPRVHVDEQALAAVGLPAFWAAVEAELVGTPWKLESSGLRDGGAHRRLVPA